MAQDLTRLIRRRPVTRPADIARMAMAPVDPAILDSAIAYRLGKQVAPRKPWVSQRDMLDALTTFVLAFTGAMLFLL